MHYGKKTAFGSLALTPEGHRKKAEKLLHSLLAYLDGFENSTGAMKASFAVSALLTHGSLIQAEQDAEVPPLSISREAGKRVSNVMDFLLRAR